MDNTRNYRNIIHFGHQCCQNVKFYLGGGDNAPQPAKEINL